eukprot:PhM_4_TR2254/c0_g1_i1/m.78351
MHTAVRQINLALLVDRRHCVLHPVRVITLWVVVARVGTTRFLPSNRTLNRHRRVREQVAELQRLDKVRVPDRGLVVDLDVVEIVHALADDVDALGHRVLRAEHSRVHGHGLLHALAQTRRRDVTLVVQNRVHVRDGLLAGTRGELRLATALLGEVEDDRVGAGLAEHDNVEERVGAEAVRAVHASTGGLTRGEQARNDCVVVATARAHNLAGPERGDATHVVVHRGHDGDRLLGDVDPGERLGGLRDAGQTLREQVGVDVVELEHHVVLLGAAATAGKDLHRHSAGHNVAGGEVHDLGGVAGHETLALGVEEVAALTAGALCDEHAGTVDTRGVELHELHIFAGEARAGNHGGAVTRAALGAGAGEVGASVATRRQDRVLGAEPVDRAVVDAHGHDAAADVLLVHDEVERQVLVEEAHAVLEGLAVERVEHGVASAIRRGTRAARLAPGAVVRRLPAERALEDERVLRAEEGQTHRVELRHHGGGLLAHVLDGVLVTEPVAALDGVEHVPPPVVVLSVRKRSVEAALGGDGVRAAGVQLRDAGDVVAGGGDAHGCAETGATGTDDDGVECVIDDGVGAVANVSVCANGATQHLFYFSSFLLPQ